MTQAATIAAPSWRLPVLMLVAGSVVLSLTMGTRHSFGLYLQPMSADLGWGREIFAFAIALQNLVWGASQPFVGAIADKYGSGRVIALAGALYVLGVWLMATGGDPVTFTLGAGFLVGVGIAGASYTVVLAGIARVYPAEKRSLVFGIAAAAGSFGQFAMVPVGSAFLAAYGWSVSLMLAAALVALVIPLAAPLAGRPDVVAGPAQSLGEAVREAGGHSGYWLLTAGYFVCGFHVVFIGTHLPAYLADRGLDPATGAWCLALIGLFNIVGSFLFGWLGGFRRKKYLLSWIYLGRAIAILGFVLLPLSAASALVFSAVIGVFWLSTVPLTTGLVGQIFGLRYLATLAGVVFFSHQVGSFLGAWMGGLLFDRTGSYDLVWWIAIALGVFAALVHYPIDDRTIERAAPAPAPA